MYYGIMKCADGGYYVRAVAGPDRTSFQNEICYAGTEIECLTYVQDKLKGQLGKP